MTQCGFLSNPIPIERGCRQGDHIARYLFLLIAEVLEYLNEKSPESTGIKIGNNMYKLTQFADDTVTLPVGVNNWNIGCIVNVSLVYVC